MARIVSVLFLSVVVSACGSSSPGGSNSTTTGGGAGPHCNPLPITGLVNFIQQDGVGTGGETVDATFAAQAYAADLNFGCDPSCRFSNDAGMLAPVAFMDVGPVTATNTSSGESKLLKEQSAPSRSVYETNALSWNFADELQIAGGTGGFPAFSIAVKAPPKITVFAPPTLAPGQTVVVSQSSGLTVTWAPSVPPASFMSLGIETQAGRINCYPPDSDGTATIAPTMLANLQVGASAGRLSIGRWNVVVDSSTGKTIGVQAEEFLTAGIQITP